MKINFRGKYENLECDICKKQEESQKHILECSEIMKETNFYNEHENQWKNVKGE